MAFTKRLQVAFFGSSLVSCYWNGAATYYRGIIKALAERGHQVVFYEPDAFDRQQNRDMADPPWAKVVVYDADQESARQALLAAQGADIIIKASGIGVLDDWLEQQVLTLRSNRSHINTVRIFWDVDAPATLERVNRNEKDPFRPLIPVYDLILTYGGGQPVIDAYSALGARLCRPIYNGLDPDSHFPVATDQRFAATLGFLGNRLPDREERVREFFFKVAEAMPEAEFILGGSGWQEHAPQLQNLRYLGHVPSGDHNAFNCTPLAVLNINRSSMAENGFSPPTRIFEAAGAGACLITDYWQGIDQFLLPGQEVLTAENGNEVIDQLRNLTPAKARAIGEAARQRVLAEHTYHHRVAELETILESFFLPVPSAKNPPPGKYSAKESK